LLRSNRLRVWELDLQSKLTSSTVNPLLERVISIFDTNKDNEVEFKEFISALSIFSDKGNKEGKLKCK